MNGSDLHVAGDLTGLVPVRAAVTGVYHRLIRARLTSSIAIATQGYWFALYTIGVLPPEATARIEAEQLLIELSKQAPCERLRKAAILARFRLGITAAGFAVEPEGSA